MANIWMKLNGFAICSLERTSSNKSNFLDNKIKYLDQIYHCPFFKEMNDKK